MSFLLLYHSIKTKKKTKKKIKDKLTHNNKQRKTFFGHKMSKQNQNMKRKTMNARLQGREENSEL